jgi:hypothetical protein
MNFKDRVRQALRQPTRMNTGGFIQDAGGGDQIVYGPTHEQGGVLRGPDVELEGGGFGAGGQPLAGEVITNVVDSNGQNQEFYMSHQNGIAQKYLQAKAQAGGTLPQKTKQEFARMNEQVSSEGQPQQIAQQGGMKRYFENGGTNKGTDWHHDFAKSRAVQQRIIENKNKFDLSGGNIRDEHGIPIPSENYIKWSKATGFGGHEYTSQEHYEKGQNIKPGTIMNGYVFNSGDPMDPTSWTYIGDMGFSGEPDPQYAPKRQGGMKKYWLGGALGGALGGKGSAFDTTRRNLSERGSLSGLKLGGKGSAWGAMKNMFNWEDGGMNKYFMGGMPTTQQESSFLSDYNINSDTENHINSLAQRRGALVYGVAEGGFNPKLEVGDTVNGVTYNGGSQEEFISRNKMRKYMNGGIRKKYMHGGPHHINEDGSAGAAIINPSTEQPWTREEYYAAKDNNSDKLASYGTTKQSYTTSPDIANKLTFGLFGDAGGEKKTYTAKNSETQIHSGYGAFKDAEGNKIDVSQFKFNPQDYDLFYDPTIKKYKNYNTDEIVEDMSVYQQNHQELVSQYLQENFEYDPQANVVGSAPIGFQMLSGPAGAIGKGSKIMNWLNKYKAGRGVVSAGKYLKSSQLNPLQGWKAFRSNVKIPYGGVAKQWQVGSALKTNAATAIKKGLIYGVPPALYSGSGSSTTDLSTDVDKLDFTNITKDYIPTVSDSANVETTQSNIYDSIRPVETNAPNTIFPDSGEVRTYNGINYMYVGGTDSEGPTNPDNWNVVE